MNNLTIDARVRNIETGRVGRVLLLSLTEFSDDYCSVAWDDMLNGWPSGYVTRRDILEVI